MSVNSIGHVVEYIQDRVVTPVGAGPEGYTDLKADPKVKVRLKLRLKNTLGQIKEIYVDGPDDLPKFFEAKLPPEVLAASAKLNVKSG